MLERRFSHPRIKPFIPPPDLHAWPAVWLNDQTAHVDILHHSINDLLYPVRVGWWIPPIQTSDIFSTVPKAITKFNSMVKGLKAKGWTETEWSLTRRVFCYPNVRRPTKFWAAALDGATLELQFGKVGRHSGRASSRGTCKSKDFASPEAAQLAYEKQIASKLAEGYKEFMPRTVKVARRATGTPKAGSSARKPTIGGKSPRRGPPKKVASSSTRSRSPKVNSGRSVRK